MIPYVSYDFLEKMYTMEVCFNTIASVIVDICELILGVNVRRIQESLIPISANSHVLVEIPLGHVEVHAPARASLPCLAFHRYLVS